MRLDDDGMKHKRVKLMLTCTTALCILLNLPFNQSDKAKEDSKLVNKSTSQKED